MARHAFKILQQMILNLITNLASGKLCVTILEHQAFQNSNFGACEFNIWKIQRFDCSKYTTLKPKNRQTVGYIYNLICYHDIRLLATLLKQSKLCNFLVNSMSLEIFSTTTLTPQFHSHYLKKANQITILGPKLRWSLFWQENVFIETKMYFATYLLSLSEVNLEPS